MDIEQRKLFYEKLYFHELEVREKIEGRLKLPLTIFAIVFAMVGFLFNESLISKKYALDLTFWVLYISSCVCLLMSVGFFIKSWYGYTYRMLPTANTIEDYHLSILEAYKSENPDKANEWTSEAFQEYLLNTFKDYASHNTTNNDSKAFYLHRCIATLVISFLLVCFSFFPYYNLIHHQKINSEITMADRPEPPKPPEPRHVKGQPPKSKPKPE